MVFIRQNFGEKIVILFLADVSEGNIFRQKAETFDFFHCGLNSGFVALDTSQRLEPLRPWALRTLRA